MQYLTDNTDTDKTLGNIYFMTLAAAARAYQLRRGHAAKVQPEKNHLTTALKELHDGKLGLGILLVEGKTKKKEKVS